MSWWYQGIVVGGFRLCRGRRGEGGGEVGRGGARKCGKQKVHKLCHDV